jgi:hypothetical protein
MNLSIRCKALLAAFLLTGSAIVSTGCTALGFATMFACDVATVGTAMDECRELGQTIANSDD